MSTIDLKKTVDEFWSEMKSYQDKVDERTKEIKEGNETRAQELLDELKKRDETLDKVTDRFDKIEASLKRVRTDEKTKDPLRVEEKLLNAFIKDDPDGKDKFRKDSFKHGLPDEVKEYGEDYKHRFSLDLKQIPANLHSYAKATQMKAMSTDRLADGGVFSLPNFGLEIIKGIRELSPIRQVARVIPISSGDSWNGTVRDSLIGSQNAGERENVSDTTTPKYKEVRIQTHERAASPALTRQQIEDSFLDIAAEIQRDGVEEFAVAEGTQFINGTGVNEPEGILTASGIDATSSGSDTLFDFDDISRMISALKTGYNGTLMFTRQTLGFLRRLKDGQSRPLWNVNVADAAPNTVYGEPFVLAADLASPSAADVYTAGDVPILYGDFGRGYYIIDRLGLDVLRDPFSNKPFIEIYMRRRYGGQVVLPEAIKKLTTTA